MPTPYYHTDQSAQEAVKAWADIEGVTIDEAVAMMQALWDDLDREDQSALAHYKRMRGISDANR